MTGVADLTSFILNLIPNYKQPIQYSVVRLSVCVSLCQSVCLKILILETIRATVTKNI